MKYLSFIALSLLAAAFVVSPSFADDTASGTTSTGSVSSGSTLSGSFSSGTSLSSTGDTVSSTGSLSGSASTGSDSTGSTISASGSTSQTGSTFTGSSSSGVAFTGTVQEMRDQILRNRLEIISNLKKYQVYYKTIIVHAKQKATRQERQALISDLKSYHAALKGLMKEGSDAIKAGTFDSSAFGVKADAFFSTWTENLTKYIDAGKIDGFKKLMDEAKQMILANAGLELRVSQLQQEIKRVIWQRAMDAFQARIDRLSRSNLQKLLTNIESRLGKNLYPTVRDQLVAFKAMIEKRLASMPAQ